MKTSQYEETDLTLKNASLEKIAATASAVIYRNKQKRKIFQSKTYWKQRRQNIYIWMRSTKVHSKGQR